MATWTLRVRGPKGQATLTGVAPDATVVQFQALLAEQTGVPATRQEVLSGFPPKLLQLSSAAADAPLSSLGIANGDSLTVREVAASEAAAPPQPATSAGLTQPAASGGQHGVSSQMAGMHPAAGAVAASTASLGLGFGGHHPNQGFQQAGGFVDEDDDPELAMAIAASLADTGAQPTQPSAPSTHTQAASTRPVAAAAAAPRDFGGYSHPPTVLGGSRTNGSHPPGSAVGGAPTSIAMPDGRAVMRRVIDSDNSCLFNAVGYVMERSRKRAAELRQTIATVVASDPVTYNEGFLGMENDAYCKWILQPDKWGGAIELSILCKHYGREIAAYDIQTKRCDVYGQDAGYTERVMLLYDGLHYDAMGVAAFEGAPEELDVTIYEPAQPDASAVERAATQLVEACHTARQFTDTANFTLRCGICQIGLQGEKEAVAHAKATGHQNFSEY